MRWWVGSGLGLGSRPVPSSPVFESSPPNESVLSRHRPDLLGGLDSNRRKLPPIIMMGKGNSPSSTSSSEEATLPLVRPVSSSSVRPIASHHRVSSVPPHHRINRVQRVPPCLPVPPRLVPSCPSCPIFRPGQRLGKRQKQRRLLPRRKR